MLLCVHLKSEGRGDATGYMEAQADLLTIAWPLATWGQKETSGTMKGLLVEVLD